jgi:hypothetical protein
VSFTLEVHFTHKTESPRPLHFKHSHWWKRRSRSKFATSHYAWGTNGVYRWMQDGCKVYMDFLHGIEWVMFHGHLECFQKPPLGGRPKTKLGDHGTPNADNHWFNVFYYVWGHACIEIHGNSIRLRAWSHMTSHYTWGSVSTLHEFEDVLGRPSDTFFGLSQFHGHGSWLVCEVALIPTTKINVTDNSIFQTLNALPTLN